MVERQCPVGARGGELLAGKEAGSYYTPLLGELGLSAMLLCRHTSNNF